MNEKIYEYQGVTYDTLVALCIAAGADADGVRKRLSRGWPLADALAVPHAATGARMQFVGKDGRARFSFQGELLTAGQVRRRLGM